MSENINNILPFVKSTIQFYELFLKLYINLIERITYSNLTVVNLALIPFVLRNHTSLRTKIHTNSHIYLESMTTAVTRLTDFKSLSREASLEVLNMCVSQVFPSRTVSRQGAWSKGFKHQEY